MCVSAIQNQSKPNVCNFFALLVWIALVLFLSSISKAERLPIKTYTVADGLLRDNVSKIKQDSRGFLWFCTAEGISRFDGYAFTSFTGKDGLPDRHVNDFLETRNGTIWIATDAGLAKLNPKSFRPFVRDLAKQQFPALENQPSDSSFPKHLSREIRQVCRNLKHPADFRRYRKSQRSPHM